MTRALLLGSLFLIAAAASAQPDTARRLAIDGDYAAAILSIDYQQQRGDLRQAMLTFASGKDTMHLSPHDKLAILSTAGQWITLNSFLSSDHTTSVQAEAMLPAPETIQMVLYKPKRGPWQGWNVKQVENNTETEWTYFNQQGREVRSAPCSPRECFTNVVIDDAGNEVYTGSSSFRMEISGFSFGVERE